MAVSEKRRAYMKKYLAKNKEREREKAKARYAADPEKYRNAQRQRYYGVSPEQAAALLVSQGSRCAICRTDTPNGRGFWHLDHDHATNKVRAFLCQACNNGLGFFRDDPLRLELAAAYLRTHKIEV